MPELNTWLQQLDKLSLRERALILLVSFLLIYNVWHLFLMQPLQAHHQALLNQAEEEQVEITTLYQSIQHVVNEKQKELGKVDQQDLAELHTALMVKRKKLQALTDHLIAPQEMSEVLKKLLTRKTQLTLLKLENFVPKEEELTNKVIKHFQHSLKLEFMGNYLDVLDYLQQLETLPWKFYWDELNIAVDDYPNAHVTLIVHTFNFNQSI